MTTISYRRPTSTSCWTRVSTTIQIRKKNAYGKGQIGCSLCLGQVEVLDNVIAGCFEEAEISGTERGPNVGFARGESQTPHANVGAKIVLHLQMQGLSVGQTRVTYLRTFGTTAENTPLAMPMTTLSPGHNLLSHPGCSVSFPTVRRWAARSGPAENFGW